MSTLQWAWQATDCCAVAATVDLKSSFAGKAEIITANLEAWETERTSQMRM
jgi:hypothetical protein